MSHRYIVLGAAAAVAAVALAAPGRAQEPQPPLGFFVTSTTHSGNLGGLAGADAECQRLAAAAGASNRTWRAYLSAHGAQSQPAVNARDRIGNGPWYNSRGALIAWNNAELHGDFEHDRNNVRKPSSLSEKGEVINGAGDTPNVHDILTGSDSHGRLPIGAAQVLTCNNWTSNSDGRTIVGHSDRLGGPNTSWNSVHSTAGCSQQQLVSTGGGGLFYCFAAE